MSVDQLSPRRTSRPSGDSKVVQYDQYIDAQIKNTRRAVKLVDLSTSLVLLATAVFGFLLAAAVVEHWLVPGGFSVAVRTILFTLLVGGVGYFTYRRLWPLLRRAINPVYAAQTIEQSSPALKNSLINLLLFRQHRAEISDAVYHTLEEQAAQRLTRVPVEAAVDRSLLIRVGYALLAVVALAALYKVLSPKDPLVTAERVLLPWSDIVPASRVSITDVKPGTTTVSRGEFLTVSAEVRGIDETDPILLRYTTDDARAVDRPIEMKLADDGLRFEARLPDEADAPGKVGLAQNLRYRIEAGDARSLEYAVKVVPAPSIRVDRIGYDYPAYTGLLDRQVEGLGDIRAIEGTRVTVHARANGPIQEAQVDFDADGRRDLVMKSSGATASASFVLELREDRQTPRHASYVLRFTNAEGRANRDPVKYPIVVQPDLQPEVSILVPQENSLDVRLDETVAMEVEARDPDFALSEVRLRGEAAGRSVLDEPLLSQRHSGRFTGRYQFTPSAHDLRAGDVVEYWVSASDNRAPTANVAESERKRLRIVSPDPQQPPPDQIAQRDPQRRPGDQQQPGEQQQQDGQQGDQQPGQQGEANQQQGQGGQQGQDGQQQGEPGGEVGRDGQQSEEQGQGDKETGRQEEQGAAGAQDEAQPDAGGEGQVANDSGGENQPGAQGQRGQPGQSGEQDSKNSSGKQTGAGTAGGDASQEGSQPDGARPDGNATARPANGGRPPGSENAEPAPVSSEGDNDAEAFERIQKHLQQSGELKDGQSAATDDRGAKSDGQTSEEEAQGQKQEANERAKQQDGESASADGSQAEQRGSEPSDQTGQRAEDRGEGTGAETRKDDLPDDAQQQNGKAGDKGESPGGQQTSTKGPSGAGDQQPSQGAPNSQPEMKPSEKRQQSGSAGEQTDDKEPAAGARGKRETDSQGEQGGDQAGGGEEGGGQKAPREGTGSAGQNQSADEGAGESSEKGAGNNSPNAGDDATATDRTGQPGGETGGRGSKQRDGQGEQPGGESGDADDAARPGAEQAQDEADGEAQEGQRQGDRETGRQGAEESRAQEQTGDASTSEQDSPSGERGPEKGGQQGGAPTGDGGQMGTTEGPVRSPHGTVPPGDPANLEYARKQTDLVLDKLADQLNREQVDEKLLDELGWTEEDLRRFVERWQQRKDAAQRNDRAGEAARRELDDALRSLGLRRGPLRQGPVKDDTQRDLRQGYRGPVPLEYQERLRQYNEAVSRSRPDGE